MKVPVLGLKIPKKYLRRILIGGLSIMVLFGFIVNQWLLGLKDRVDAVVFESVTLNVPIPTAEEATLGEVIQESSGEELRSMIMHGIYEEDGRIFDLILAVKVPGLIKKTLSDSKITITCGVSEDQAWISVAKEDVVLDRQPLTSELHQNSLAWEAALWPMVRMVSDVSRFRDIGISDDGVGLRVLERFDGDMRQLYYFDAVTGLECKRELHFAIGGQSHQLSVFSEDYRDVNGYILPFYYRIVLNDEVRGVAKIQRIELNSGLMPWMFHSQ